MKRGYNYKNICKRYGIKRQDTARVGVQNGNAKLAEWQVKEIALDYITPTSDLARRFKVSVWTIRGVRKGKTYRNVR